MRRPKLLFAFIRVLVLSLWLSAFLLANGTSDTTTQKPRKYTLLRQNRALQPVPSLAGQVLAKAIQAQPIQSTPGETRTLQRRRSVFALIWSAAYSLAATILLLGFIRWRWTKRASAIFRNMETKKAETHHSQRYTPPPAPLERLLDAEFLSIGDRKTFRPRESEAAVFARKIQAHETSRTLASLHSLLRDSGAKRPINVARRTSRSKGEIELALHLEELQQTTNVIGGTA